MGDAAGLLGPVGSADNAITMYVRIFTSPPGYPDHQKYMARKYVNLEHGSASEYLKNKDDDSIFFPTVESARSALPTGAKLLPPREEISPMFIEIWQLE
jgi:hypothetical protein